MNRNQSVRSVWTQTVYAALGCGLFTALFSAPVAAQTLQPSPAPLSSRPLSNPNAEHWIPLPMLNSAQEAAGIFPGGEGCQYPESIAIDGLNGNFILFGTDVGGIYRSTNGGKSFSPCDMGYFSIGSCGFAIDPRTPIRCLSIGDNSGGDYYEYDGVYLSTNQGATWTQVLPKQNRGNEHGREQVAFDPGSYNATLGYCTVAYWAEEGNPKETGGRLYKSNNGGQTWAQVATGSAYGGGNLTTLLKIAPKSKAVYLANDSGFYKSTNGGLTFSHTLTANLTSLDVIPSQLNTVLITTQTALMRSTDGGATFTTITSAGMSGFKHLHVSPVNTNLMTAQNPTNSQRYFSTDGGLTWNPTAKNLGQSWIPTSILYDDRDTLAVWHPTNANITWGIGPGDIITNSVDGGATFQWANNGNNGIMTGGLFNFNAQNPNLIYIGSQDYNGAVTMDAGKTWEFVNLSNDNFNSIRGDDSDPWGWVYGGYAATPLIYYGGNRAYTDTKYNLWITYDGGKTTQQVFANLSGVQVSNGDPTDPNVLFCWSCRSADQGKTWTQMTACDGVFTTTVKAGKSVLFGSKANALISSTDKGVTWQTLATLPNVIRDIAYDTKNDRFFVPDSNNRLQECDGPSYAPVDIAARLPVDEHGDGMAVSTIAVDPVNTNVIYAGANGTGLYYLHNNGVARSLDGGKTWETLTCNPAYCWNGVTGGQMASAIRVHPVTRYLYVGSDCYGVWKIAPPAAVHSGSSQ